MPSRTLLCRIALQARPSLQLNSAGFCEEGGFYLFILNAGKQAYLKSLIRTIGLSKP